MFLSTATSSSCSLFSAISARTLPTGSWAHCSDSCSRSLSSCLAANRCSGSHSHTPGSTHAADCCSDNVWGWGCCFGRGCGRRRWCLAPGISGWTPTGWGSLATWRLSLLLIRLWMFSAEATSPLFLMLDSISASLILSCDRASSYRLKCREHSRCPLLCAHLGHTSHVHEHVHLAMLQY